MNSFLEFLSVSDFLKMTSVKMTLSYLLESGCLYFLICCLGFLPRRKHLLISWLQLPSAVILDPKKIKSLTVSIVSPSIYHEVVGPDAMILVF